MAIYLIKVSVCWGLFALLYQMLLRKETFFKSNRIYLMSGIILGLLLPVLPEEIIYRPVSSLQLPVVEVQTLSVSLEEIQIQAHSWGYGQMLWLLYGIGVLITGARLLYGLVVLIRRIRKGKSEKIDGGFRLIRSNDTITPHSFFYWIFVPAHRDEPAYQETLMLAHEKAHARAWHSLDILFIELLAVMAWFHPLVYWYRSAIREAHEFQADAAASRYSDKKQYGLLLIGQSQSGMPVACVNHFFQSPLKQRLLMLTRKDSSPQQALKFGLILPLTLLIALLFRPNTTTAQQTDGSATTASKSADAIPAIPGGMSALGSYLADHIRYPETARNAREEGTVVVSFDVSKKGEVKNAEGKPAEGEVHPDLITEAVRVISDIPSWKPAVKDGKVVDASYCVPIRFKLDAEKAAELSEVEKLPEFPGGSAALGEYLGKNIKYPEAARKAGESGLVVIKFVVEKEGSLSNFEVVKSPGQAFSDEAVRVLKSMPNFSPGIKGGKPVRVSYTLPVRFAL